MITYGATGNIGFMANKVFITIMNCVSCSMQGIKCSMANTVLSLFLTMAVYGNQGKTQIHGMLVMGPALFFPFSTRSSLAELMEFLKRIKCFQSILDSIFNA